MSKKQLKIVLATGIFFPDIGGPAIHVRKIAEALAEKGYRPVILTYGDYNGAQVFPFKVIRVSNKLNPLIRRIIYSLHVFKESFGAKILYAFNVSTAGIPVIISGKILRKKTIIRVPGDPIWERIVENGERLISFSDYYERGLYMKDRPWKFRIIKFTLPRFDKLVFYTPFLSEIYTKYYGVDSKKITIILNPVFKRELLDASLADEPTILFAGRFVAYKNLELVIRVFNRVRENIKNAKLILIGSGPDEQKLKKLVNQTSPDHISIIPKVAQEKLFEYISSSWVAVGPALTEFNPNFILECLSFNKPVLLSKENGLSVQLPEEFLFNPSDEDEFKTKLEGLLSEESYLVSINKIKNLPLNQSWDNVIYAHMRLLEI